MRKLLCKPRDPVATEDKDIVYEIDCSNCEAVYFAESKQSCVRNCDCDKNEIAEHYWEADHNFSLDQKKIIDRRKQVNS